jgi:DNA-binding response OmpR family regulator
MDYDENRIQHVIYNLLSNAIKFTDAGGKVILHLREIRIEDQPFIQIKVSDTGKGIREDQLPKIFDRFYQESSAEIGTGIGLALSKEFVEMMGGKIVVESQLAYGTDFLVLLPVQKTLGLPKGTKTSKIQPVSRTPVLPGKVSLVTRPNHDMGTPLLLIIEDNRDVITYIETFLAPHYRLVISFDGEAGMEQAFEQIPDIILSDVMIPGKNGFELCEILKNDERTSHIPIILLTAKAKTEDRIKGLKLGADAYLTKPFNQEELLVRLQKLLELRSHLQEKYTIPGALSDEPLTNLEDAFIQKMRALIEARLEDVTLNVKDLEGAANLSNMQLNRKLKALTGKTPSSFIRLVRLQKARVLLTTTNLNISQVAYEVGFKDPAYFTRTFSKAFGISPSDFRKK